MTVAVHQVVPVLSEHDATGQHTRQVQRLLRRHGIASEIYAGHVVEGAGGSSRPLKDLAAADVVVYQCSVGSDLAAWCLERPEPLVVNYHNMTPAAYFDAWQPDLAAVLRSGRQELVELAGRAELGIADSAFNAGELAGAGYRHTVVAPLLVDLDRFDAEPDARVAERLAADRERRGGGPDWLFVGRVVPNKAQHDLIGAFAAWCRVTRAPSRLHLVGGSAPSGYEAALRQLTRALGVEDRVHFVGPVSHPELVAYYQAADVFVCLSEHEGFCVPVLEAMHLGLPVVALAEAAVPETVAGAGVLLDTKRPLDVVAAVERVTTDQALRAELVRRGRRRAADFALVRTEPAFLAALEPVLGRS